MNNIKIVKYGAKWCSQCAVMSKMLESLGLSKYVTEYDIEEVDLPDASIKSLPYIEVYKCSKLKFKHAGMMSINELNQVLTDINNSND